MSTVTVISVAVEEEEVRTFNLDIEQVDTYFVIASSRSVLVHNAENDIVPYNPKNSPNFNHHGVMNAWLEANMAGLRTESGEPAYRGRSEGGFPTVELSPESHARATAWETQWRAEYRQKNGVARIDWTKVSPREYLKLAVRA